MVWKALAFVAAVIVAVGISFPTQWQRPLATTVAVLVVGALAVLNTIAADKGRRERSPADPYGASQMVLPYVLTLVELGLLLAGLAAQNWAVGVLLGLGHFLIGSLVGFLFGVPERVTVINIEQQGAHGLVEPGHQQPAQLASTIDQPMRRTRSNIEQIADWLTKIVIGITFVNLGEIPRAIDRWSWYVGSAMASEASATLGYALIVYFCPLGLLAGYMLTRLFLVRLLF